MPAPEGQQVAAEREDGVGIVPLRRHVGGRRVAQGQPGPGGLGEAGTRAVTPLHGGAAGVTALVVRVEPHPERVAQVFLGHGDVRHADLVALVQDRRATQAEQHEEGLTDLGRIVLGPAGGEAEHVVVGAGPGRPGAGRQRRLGLLDDGAHIRGPEGRVDEVEVEGEPQLVCPVSVELGQLVHRDRGLADQEPGLVVGLGLAAPASDHLVHLGPVGVVHTALAEHLRLEVVVLGRGRIVAELGILDDDVADVDAEAGHAPIGPEAEDLVERGAHLLVPPVEVGLLLQVVVEVVLAGCLVEGPAWSAEAADPVVRGLPVLAVGPDVPVPAGGRARRTRVDEPRVLLARVVGHDIHEDADAAGRLRRRARRSRRGCRTPARWRRSPRRRSPSRHWGRR